jgi:hypothetical protein
MVQIRIKSEKNKENILEATEGQREISNKIEMVQWKEKMSLGYMTKNTKNWKKETD